MSTRKGKEPIVCILVKPRSMTGQLIDLCTWSSVSRSESRASSRSSRACLTLSLSAETEKIITEKCRVGSGIRDQ
jgi:hypothetical protein